jgi:hypothetical protein
MEDHSFLLSSYIGLTLPLLLPFPSLTLLSLSMQVFAYMFIIASRCGGGGIGSGKSSIDPCRTTAKNEVFFHFIVSKAGV